MERVVMTDQEMAATLALLAKLGLTREQIVAYLHEESRGVVAKCPRN